tara:strand:+ start:436 stop:1302 length:867 start_codon:yes stop_codon:yes gene_type:complete
MKNMNKNITRKTRIYLFLETLVPPIFLERLLDFLITLKFLIFYPFQIKNDLPLESFKKSSDKAFLFATGPSLKEFDFSIVKNSDCFSVSNFFINDEANNINLRGHFFAPWHPPLVKEEYLAWIMSAHEKLSTETIFFFGEESKADISRTQLSETREVNFIKLEKGLVFGSLRRNFPILKPYSGPLMILPILIILGYREIYLCGCDHTVLRDFNSTVSNFYDDTEDIRSNATKDKRWENGIEYHLHNMINIIKQYKKYGVLARKRKINIYNLSNDSWIESFPLPKRSEP